MIKVFVLDVSLGGVVAASTEPALDGTFTPSFFDGPRPAQWASGARAP